MTTPPPAPAATSSPDPSSSVLLALARAAFASSGGETGPAWPELDLGDPLQRHFGDFELLEEIGRGGMGIVYRARQSSLEREVALKFVAAGHADHQRIDRLRHEARAAARLVHPNIVPVHEAGTIDGVHYFSMALVDGHSLSTVARDQRPSPETTLSLMVKLCDAMDYAHRLGLLHLDLKPANVLIDARGEPLVADFGLARRVDEGGGFTARDVSGTPAFMAPEQVLIHEHRLTAATDIYALGAILYWCLTGSSPHGTGPSEDMVRRAVAGDVPRPRALARSVSRDMEAICLKCLALRPGDRYSSVARLADDLRRTRDGMPVSVRRAGFVERAGLWVRREPVSAFGILFAALALVGGTLASLSQARLAQAARAEAVRQRDAALAAEAGASQARDRAVVASEMGAFLFANYGEARNSRELARRLIEWSGRRLPDDEAGQASALENFATAVRAFNQRRFIELNYSLVEALGADYRAQVSAKLNAGASPTRHLHAAMLSWADTPAGVVPASYRAAMDAALALAPDDPMTLHVAALFNPEGATHPLYPDAARRLVQLQPENLYHWLLLLISPGAVDRRATLGEAARRTYFDDYFRSGFVDYELALATSGVEVPPLLVAPLGLLRPAYTLPQALATFHTRSLPFDVWDHVRRFCDPAGGQIRSALDRSNCVEIGTVMARSEAGIGARMAGVAIVRRLAPGSDLAQEMTELRRSYVYMREQRWSLPADLQLFEDFGRSQRDVRELGELEAYARTMERAGISRVPPPHWQPAHPEDMKPPVGVAPPVR